LCALPAARVDTCGLVVRLGPYRSHALLSSCAALDEESLRASLAFRLRLCDETAALTSCFLLGSGRIRPCELEQRLAVTLDLIEVVK
jgi:hypothetical protein